MKIYKVIADKIPTICQACPISVMHTCGKEQVVKPTSSGAYKIVVPDSRCKIRVGKI